MFFYDFDARKRFAVSSKLPSSGTFFVRESKRFVPKGKRFSFVMEVSDEYKVRKTWHRCCYRTRERSEKKDHETKITRGDICTHQLFVSKNNFK